MKNTFLFSMLVAFVCCVSFAVARPTKFAECRNGKVIYWTLGKDGAYHSQQTDISCNFKKDVNLSNTHGKIAQPVVPIAMNETEWNQYYQQNKLNIEVVVDTSVYTSSSATKKNGSKAQTSIAAKEKAKADSLAY